MTTAVAPAESSAALLDRILEFMIVAAFALLFLAPTRVFHAPFETTSDYLFFPLNLMDLAWASIGAILFLRTGGPPAKAVIGTAVLILFSLVVASRSTTALDDKLADALLFNFRLAGALAIGWMLVRAGFPAKTLGAILVLGSFVVAMASLSLAQSGGSSYSQHSELLRYGSLGLPPNETSLVLAAAFNALPLLFPGRPWLAPISPLLLLGILLTGSRTGILLVTPGVLFWIPAILKTFRGPRGILAWALFSALAAFEVWLLVESVISMLTGQTLAPVAGRLSQTTDESTIGRFQIYAQVPAYIYHNTSVLLFGSGGSNVAVESLIRDNIGIETLHTHNLILQLVAAYGLLGLVVLGIIVRPLLRLGKRYPDDDARAIRWFVLTLVVGQMVQYGMSGEKFLLLFAIPAGFAAAASSRAVVPEVS